MGIVQPSPRGSCRRTARNKERKIEQIQKLTHFVEYRLESLAEFFH